MLTVSMYVIKKYNMSIKFLLIIFMIYFSIFGMKKVSSSEDISLANEEIDDLDYPLEVFDFDSFVHFLDVFLNISFFSHINATLYSSLLVAFLLQDITYLKHKLKSFL